MSVVDQIGVQVDGTTDGSVLGDSETKTDAFCLYLPAKLLEYVNLPSGTDRRRTYRCNLQADGPGYPLEEIVGCHIRRVMEVTTEIGRVTLEHLENESWSGFGVGGRHGVFRRHDGMRI